jgi:DNA-binding transcriptional regulator YhcF (GntR family)
MKELTKTAIVFSAIKDKIRKGELVEGDKLSPVLTLAKEFCVSTFIIIKAFELLEKERLITRVNKSGVYIGTKTKNEPISCKKVSAKTRAEEIADSITSEIIQGSIKVGEQMTMNKILAFKYTTTNRTIHKAIEILIDNKYIHKDGFRHVIGQPTGATLRSAKRCLYILANQLPANWKFTRGYDKIFFQPFERELQKRGITLFEYLNLWNEPDLINKIKEETTAGFLIDLSNLFAGSNRCENLQTRFYKTVEIISKKKLPLVVDSYNDILRLIPNFTFKPMPNLFFIGHDDYKAGEKIGTYLASMGHKQVAYFCFGNTLWNLERFRGVEQAIKRHFNSGSNIHFFHDDSDDYNWHADLSTYASTPREEKNGFFESYSKLFKGYQFQHHDPAERVYPLLANRIYEDILKKKMTPLFEKALKIKEITGWIGTGPDDTAAAAEFLMEHRVDMPNEISLIGFGDIGNTMEYGITVFDFMENNAGYLAAHCILGDIPIKKNRKGYVEYEGQIMVRKSVKAI